MPNPLELLETKYGTVKKKVDIDPLISLEQKYNISPFPTAKDPLEVLEKKYAVRPTFADRLRPITERITPTLTKIAKWTGLAPLLPVAHPKVSKLFKEPAELFAAKYTKIEQAPGKAILRRLGFKEARSFIEKMPKIPDTIGGIPKWLVIPKLFPKPTNPVIKKYMPEAYMKLADFETEYQKQLGGYILDYMTSPTVWALWTIPAAFRIGGFKLHQRLTLNKQTLLKDIMDESAKRMIPFVQSKSPSMSVSQAKVVSEEWLARFFSQELGKIGGLKEISYLKMLRFAKKLSKSSYPFVKDWKPPKPHYEFVKGHITGKAPSPAEAKYATELKRLAITSTRAPGRMAPPIAPPTEVPKPPVAPPTEVPEKEVKTFYHGTNVKSTIESKGFRGGWATDDPKIAKRYGKEVIEMKIPDSSLIDIGKYKGKLNDIKALEEFGKKYPNKFGLIDRSPSGTKGENLVYPFPGRKPEVTPPKRAVDLTHSREDMDYWGEQIAKITKDPRNITKAEWKKIDPIYDYMTLSEIGDEHWRNALAVAERIAVERGDIITGPGEGKVRLPEYRPELAKPEEVSLDFPKELKAKLRPLMKEPIKNKAKIREIIKSWYNYYPSDPILHAEKILGITPIKAVKGKVAKLQTPEQTAQKVIGKRETLPILNNVLVKKGELIATDLETGFIVKTDKPDGLYKFIGKNLEKSDLDVQDFPEVPRPKIDLGKISSRQELITNLERASRSVSTDETRYVITGPLLDVKNGKGEMIATDGFRLSVSDIELKNFKDGKYIIANPKKVINALKGISGESLTVKTDKKKTTISFEGDNGLVVVRLIEGKFPEYTKVFPKPNQQYIVNKSDLDDALKILNPYAKEVERTTRAASSVTIDQKGKDLVLTSGKKSIKVPVQVKNVSYAPEKGTVVMPLRDEGIKHMVKIDYFTDAVKSIKGDKVFIGLTKEKVTDPFHIYGEDLSLMKPTKVAKPTVPKKEIPEEVAPPEVPEEVVPPTPEEAEMERIAGPKEGLDLRELSLDEFLDATPGQIEDGWNELYEKTEAEMKPLENQIVKLKADLDKLPKRSPEKKPINEKISRLKKEMDNLKTTVEDSFLEHQISLKEELTDYIGERYEADEDTLIELLDDFYLATTQQPGIQAYFNTPNREVLEVIIDDYAKAKQITPIEPTEKAKPTTPEEETMMNGGEEIEDYEAGGQQFPPTEEIVRRQAYEKHIMQCLKSLAEMAPKDMVTNKQKALAHILAQKKKLTTRQLHRLEKIISDLTTMGPLTPTGRIKKTYMTKQQAGELIKALHKFFVPAYKKPTIPRGKLTAKDLQVIKTDLMKKPMRRVDVARLIKNARKVIRDPEFRPHFINAYWEWVSSLKETAIGPKVLSMDMWAPRIEKRTGLPIYSGIYLPFEDAARGLKVETMGFWKEVEGIWGSHLKSPEPEDGDLALRVHHALIGDEEYFVDAPLTSEELKIVEKCREFYDKYFAEFDIGHYQDYYSPRIRQSGGVKVAYAGRIPKELRFAAELERVGLLSPSIEDERILMRIYFYGGARKKHYGPVLKQANEIKRFLPPNTLDAVEGYIGQKLGYGTKGQRVLEKTMDNIMQSLKIELGPPQLLTALYFSSLYGGALGFRLHPIIRNSFQTFLMGYPEYGKWLAPGLKRSFWKGGISKWRNKGLLVDWGVPYGEEIDRAIEGVGSNAERLINLYRKIVRVGLIPYGKWIDTLNRANMANACDARFNHWLKKYKDGKISLKRFAKKINLKGEDEFVQKEVINHIQNKDYEKALDRLVMIGIDNTQWPYRKGVGPQLGYGLGKFASTFWVWPHRYAETIIGKWIARRQWGKIWRWLLVGYAMKKLGDKLNISVLRWVHLGPLAISLTPAINTLYHIAGICKGASWGNKREIDEHWQDLKRSAPVFIGYGIFARNIYEFLKAAENGFVYYDKKGRYRYQLTPTQALLKAGGFTPKGLQERRKITGRFYNEVYSIKKAKKDINDMWATGRHAKAMKNYHKFLRRYYEVYLPTYWKYKAKYGKDYRLRTGKEIPLVSPFIRTELKGLREQQ